MAAVISCKGAFRDGRSSAARVGAACPCEHDGQRYLPSVNKAHHAGFWEAFADAANAFAGATDMPCSRNVPLPGGKAAYTTVATTTAMVVARAVPPAIKRLAGVLVDDALKAVPPTAGDLPGDAAERKNLQEKSASKVAAALFAGAVKPALAAWGVAPVRILQRGHPYTCRNTAVTPSLLRTAIHAAGLAGDGR
ncbi:hypothetical protein I4F81_007650 [Pyropia yezoensis]|uniref:Uncharacterized protein n=1 Tax=Pyropia yezoensis TaxID=2788 RepID=A0ACC3C590_PYRYE|nr:hypothetical protein I4F81_007650 [Neopyropia yezoensis]